MSVSTTIKIGGDTIDITKPCDVATALRKAELAVVAGETVTMVRFGDDETRFSSGNLARLRELIAYYDGLCAESAGKRKRFAAGIRWR